MREGAPYLRLWRPACTELRARWCAVMSVKVIVEGDDRRRSGATDGRTHSRVVLSVRPTGRGGGG